MERARTPRGREAGRGAGSRTGGSGSGAQMPTLQANAHTRRNSLYDLPRTWPGAAAHQRFPGAALEAFSLQAQKVRLCYQLTHVHFSGAQTRPRWPLQTRPPLSEQAGPVEPPAGSWTSSVPSPLVPVSEESGGALTGRTWRRWGWRAALRAPGRSNPPWAASCRRARTDSPGGSPAAACRVSASRPQPPAAAGQARTGARGPRRCPWCPSRGSRGGRGGRSVRIASGLLGTVLYQTRLPWASAAQRASAVWVAAFLSPRGAPRRSAAGPDSACCCQADLRSGPGCSRCRGGERCCCRPPALCGAASPLARSFFKALQPELRAQWRQRSPDSQAPSARPRFPSSRPLPLLQSRGWEAAGGASSRQVLSAPVCLAGGGFRGVAQRELQGTPTLTPSRVPATQIRELKETCFRRAQMDTRGPKDAVLPLRLLEIIDEIHEVL